MNPQKKARIEDYQNHNCKVKLFINMERFYFIRSRYASETKFRLLKRAPTHLRYEMKHTIRIPFQLMANGGNIYEKTLIEIYACTKQSKYVVFGKYDNGLSHEH